MTFICQPIRARGFIYLFFAAAVTISGAARAQSSAVDISDPNVTVDLSVLNDNGGGALRPGGLLTRPGGFRLLVPGIRPPRSRLYIRPKGVAKKSAARKRPLVKKTKAPAAMAVKMPPPPKIAAPAHKKKAAPKPPPEQITAAPPPPPALKPMKAETKVAAKVKATAKKKLEKPAAIAPRKLVPPPEVKKALKKKEAKKEPVKSSPLKAVAEIPAPAAAKKETASLPPLIKAAPAPSANMNMKVVFAADTSRLPNPVKAKLNDLAGMMKKKEELRIQLLAYAGGKSLSPSKARRLSLSRALSVRSYLIEKGIRSTRIDVRALGNKTTEEPLNRVDVNVIKR
jgi:outer membrane protein OmpA-like peptidoglycan-associated protein